MNLRRRMNCTSLKRAVHRSKIFPPRSAWGQLRKSPSVLLCQLLPAADIALGKRAT
jgi:hypothetical protein